MQLNGIEFGNAFCASGARNFTGKGYPFHGFFTHVGLGYKGSTLITKTVTTSPRTGNMPLKKDGLTPESFSPDCIYTDLWRGLALNAVGLSNFGTAWLLRHPEVLTRTEPFFISFMPVADTVDGRIEEVRCFVELLMDARSPHKPHTTRLSAPIAIQLNVSCPNTGHQFMAFLLEVDRWLTILSEAESPIVVKFNAITPINAALQISQHPHCSAISVSNTIPWFTQAPHIKGCKPPPLIPWLELFGTEISPLAKYGGGGLSGAPILPLVEWWIERFRDCDKELPIMGGGGILCKKDADRLIAAGADAIELGSVAFLRPWRVQGIINHINRRFDGA